MTTKTRDEYRAKLFGKKDFRKELLNVAFPGGESLQVEVRQPTQRARGEILKAAGIGVKDRDPDASLMMIEAVIACTFVPGTDERVFEPADRDALQEAPAGGWLDELAQAAQNLINVDKKETEKN